MGPTSTLLYEPWPPLERVVSRALSELVPSFRSPQVPEAAPGALCSPHTADTQVPGAPAQGWPEESAEPAGPAFVAASRRPTLPTGPHGGPGAGEWRVPQAHVRWGRCQHSSTRYDIGNPGTFRLFLLILSDLEVQWEWGVGTTVLINSNPGFWIRARGSGVERHPFLALTLSLSIGLHSLGLHSLGSKIGLLTIFLFRLRELERICVWRVTFSAQQDPESITLDVVSREGLSWSCCYLSLTPRWSLTLRPPCLGPQPSWKLGDWDERASRAEVRWEQRFWNCCSSNRSRSSLDRPEDKPVTEFIFADAIWVLQVKLACHLWQWTHFPSTFTYIWKVNPLQYSLMTVHRNVVSQGM